MIVLLLKYAFYEDSTHPRNAFVVELKSASPHCNFEILKSIGLNQH